MPTSSSPIIVALDYPNAAQALEFISKINPQSCRLKIGNELFTSEGTSFVWDIVKDGFDVFLDLKFHDIPNTVAHACSAAADLGVWMINVHCLGGRKMLEAASNAVNNSLHRPLLIGVTILTSSQEETIAEVGLTPGITQHVHNLAKLAEENGLDGVVCSPQECLQLRQERSAHFKLITPGIRLEKNKVTGDDQQRIATPQEALQAGANFLVIGRPITQAADPLQKLAEINQLIAKS